jgi:hypothetical protein
MNRNAILTGIILVLLGTIIFAILKILTQDVSLVQILLFAVTSAITYAIVTTIIAKWMKK